MAYKLMQATKITPSIKILEYGNEESNRYFRAVIQGWRNFKFVSDTLKPMQLLEKTILKCKELDEEIRKDRNSLETMPSLFKF